MTGARRSLLAGALGAVLMTLATLAAPSAAGAHSAGRVQLLVSKLDFRPVAPGAGSGVVVSADLIDRDSGEPAAGFAVSVTAQDAQGATAGPVTLTDPRGTGRYEGRLAIGPGSWTVTARAEQGTSAVPALGSAKAAGVTVDQSGTVRTGAQETPAETGAQETPTTVPRYGERALGIALEVRTDYPDTLPSSLYVPLRARLTDGETGQPVADTYAVRAVVRIPGQPPTEAYDFAYPYGTVAGAEAGIYNGIVIVPAGGRWTVIVNAYSTKEAQTARLPRSLGVAQIEVEATGPPLQTTQGRRSNDVAGNINPKGEASQVALLFVHTIVAGLWFALAGLLAVLGLPNRRRLLSSHLSDLLDRNIRKLTRGLLWTTVLVWGTGLLNLQKAVPFPPPLSSAQATRLFRLPYARPYTLALYTKIGVYAVLTLVAVAAVKEAKRRVVEFDDARFRAELAGATAPASAVPTQPQGAAIAFSPRRSAVAVATRPSMAVAPPKTNGTPAAAGAAFRFAAASLAVGGVAIIFCVTLLKYFHVLSETVRGLQ